MNKYTGILLLISLFSVPRLASAQAQVIDEVAAVVGSNIILQSDIEMQYAQYLAQGNKANENFKC